MEKVPRPIHPGYRTGPRTPRVQTTHTGSAPVADTATVGESRRPTRGAKESVPMSTRSCIARPVGDGWEGRYHHSDGGCPPPAHAA